MWFNILPSYLIVAGACSVGGYGCWWAHYLLIGNHYRRNLDDRWNRHLYQRDLRLTGNPYKIAGLESIKD